MPHAQTFVPDGTCLPALPVEEKVGDTHKGLGF